MGYARNNLISLQDTPYYHCIDRCVRRCWLWGIDEYAGRDHSHRKQWVLNRLTQLCGIFSVVRWAGLTRCACTPLRSASLGFVVCVCERRASFHVRNQPQVTNIESLSGSITRIGLFTSGSSAHTLSTTKWTFSGFDCRLRLELRGRDFSDGYQADQNAS
jgi:hypothetical protein